MKLKTINEYVSKIPTELVKFMNSIHTINNTINWNDITVEFSDSGDLYVYVNNKYLTTLSGNLLPDYVIDKYDMRYMSDN